MDAAIDPMCIPAWHRWRASLLGQRWQNRREIRSIDDEQHKAGVQQRRQNRALRAWYGRGGYGRGHAWSY
jgi:hypothetical protein